MTANNWKQRWKTKCESQRSNFTGKINERAQFHGELRAETGAFEHNKLGHRDGSEKHISPWLGFISPESSGRDFLSQRCLSRNHDLVTQNDLKIKNSFLITVYRRDEGHTTSSYMPTSNQIMIS